MILLFEASDVAVGEFSPTKVSARPTNIPDWEKTLNRISDAIANGTHGDTFTTVCDGCREWVDGIYHLDGKRRLCVACATTMGQGPKGTR